MKTLILQSRTDDQDMTFMELRDEEFYSFLDFFCGNKKLSEEYYLIEVSEE